MKTMLFKHIFMKIRQNYKRFLSLLFMALLGIGFYAGIEACSPDMLKTLDKFYDDNNVYDIKVVSNLGLDDKDINEMLTKLLTNNNYNVLNAYSGTEGVLVHNDNIDLILLDLMLPGKNGEEIIRELKNKNKIFL